jgi:hypothetical protein
MVDKKTPRKGKPEPIPDKELRASVAVDLWEISRSVDAIDGVQEIIREVADATGEDLPVAVSNALLMPIRTGAEALDNLRLHLGIPLYPPKKEGR